MPRYLKVQVAHENNECVRSEIDEIIGIKSKPGIIWHEHWINVESIHHFAFYKKGDPLNDVDEDVTLIWEYGKCFWLKITEKDFLKVMGYSHDVKIS
jgi:hypothetical protein